MDNVRCLWYRLIALATPKKYPLKIPPPTDSDKLASILEMARQPCGIINGHKITFWIYHDQNDRIAEVVEAGHASSAICGKVTSIIYDILADLLIQESAEPRVEIKIFTAGAAWFRVLTRDPEAQGRLRKSMEEIQKFGRKTGLVELVQLPATAREEFHQKLEDHNTAGDGSGSRPVIGRKDGRGNSSPGTFSFTSFPHLHTGEYISFRIPRRLYDVDRFEDLLRLHQVSFRAALRSDARQRARVYCEWLLGDVLELTRLRLKKETLRKRTWQAKIIPYSGFRNYYLATSDSAPIGKDPEFQHLERLYHEWENEHRKNPKTEPPGTDDLITIAESWKRRSAHIAFTLDYGTTSHKERLERTAPSFILEDVHWLSRMIRTSILESDSEASAVAEVRYLLQPLTDDRRLPVVAKKKITTALRVESVGELWQSLQALVEGFVEQANHLPERLLEGLPKLFEELKSIGQGLKEREKRTHFNKTVNEGILVDCMLRGWPSFFLQTKDMRQRYDNWSQEVRQRIWREIWCQSRKQRVRISPLLEENVTFAVTRTDETVHIVPYAGVNSESFALLADRRIGVPHYASCWSYRERKVEDFVETKAQEVKRLLTDLEEAIAGSDVGRATQCLRSALTTHPVEAWSQFLEILWRRLGDSDDPMVEAARLLREGIGLVQNEQDFSLAKKALQRYTQKYPLQLPDPYMLLAACGKLQRLDKLKIRRKKLIEQHKEFLNSINAEAEGDRDAGLIASVALNPAKSSDLMLYDLVNAGQRRRFKRMSALDILKAGSEEMKRERARRAVDQSMILTTATAFKKTFDEEMERARGKIESMGHEIEEIEEHFLPELENEDAYRQAAKIDEKYAEEILRKEDLGDLIFRRSEKFYMEYQPYFDLFLADEKMEIATRLFSWVGRVKKIELDSREPIAGGLSVLLSEVQSKKHVVSQNNREHIDRLRKAKLKDILATHYMEDSFVYLDLIDETQKLAEVFLYEATILYDAAHAGLPSYAPAYMRSLGVRCTYYPYYLESLETIYRRGVSVKTIMGNKTSVRRDTSASDSPALGSVRVVDDRSIVALSVTGEVLAAIDFDNDDLVNVRHVQRHLKGVDVEKSLRLKSSLAEGILSTLIEPPPATRLLLEVVRRLQPEIVCVLGYLYGRIGVAATAREATGIPYALRRLFHDLVLGSPESQEDARHLLDLLDNAPTVSEIKIPNQSIQDEVTKRHEY